MTEQRSESPHGTEARHHEGMRGHRLPHVRLAAAAVLGGAAAAVANMRLAGSGPDERLALGLLAAVLIWCCWPVHLAIASSLRRGQLTTQLIGGIAGATTWMWAAVSAGSDHAAMAVNTAAVVAFLIAIIGWSGTVSGSLDQRGAQRWWAPALACTAVLTALGWWAVQGADAVARPVVSVLAAGTPASLTCVSAIVFLSVRRQGRQRDVRSLSWASLHAAAMVDTVVLEKSGTVTTGELHVVSVDPVEPDHDRNLRWFAGALGHAATDPIGRAIAQLAAPGRLTSVEELPGQGITGSVDRHPVRLGHPGWIQVSVPDRTGITVAVEVDGRPLGHITVADQVRQHAGEQVQQLRDLGIDTVLISGDTFANTRHIADLVGIRRSCADEDPVKRAQLVRNLHNEGHRVAVVSGREDDGDMRDLADVSAGPGPDADIALASIDIAVVASILRLCRSATQRIERLTAVATVCLSLVVFLAAIGALSPLAGAAASACVAVGASALSSWPHGGELHITGPDIPRSA